MSKRGSGRHRLILTCAVLAALATRTAFAAEPPDPRSGQLRIYVSMSTEAVQALNSAFAKHFPNLKVDWVRAGSVQTVSRFVAERQAGKIVPDLIHGADPGGFDYFAAQGWLDDRLVKLPEISAYRPGFFDVKDDWIAMRATGIALMYNTKLIKAADAPKSWKDLLDPKWKGKIAISNPTQAGSSLSHLYAMWKLYGVDYLKKLGANDVFVAGDGNATRDAVANGEREIAPISEYDAFRLKEEGKPVDVIWPSDGTLMVPAPLAIAKGSTNADTALVFAKYALSKEGQEVLAKAVNTWSARKDVKAPAMKPELDQIKVANIDWKKASTEKDQLLDLYFTYVQGK